MVNTAHMTKLEAINEMLFSVGESPVQSLASGLQDAELAETILDNESRRIQSRGWHCNTRRNVVLSPNNDSQFVIGIDALKVDTVNPRYARSTNTPSPSSYINVSMRRSADDTKWLLYDVDNATETWGSDVTSMTVDIVEFLDFKNLPSYLQNYIMYAAAHRFQKGIVSSRVLAEFTMQDVQQAMIDAIADDLEQADDNIFHHDPASNFIAYRYNPSYGR
jgi:hypothetical protein